MVREGSREEGKGKRVLGREVEGKIREGWRALLG
jgi:hypothetical protein